MGFLRTALVVALTAIVIVYLPNLFTTKLPVIVDGKVEPGFEDVIKAFRENFESGRELPESGSAFAAYYKGKKVVDIWGGYADAEAFQPWREDTMTIVYSVTKGMAALCMAMLVDRGHLDYDEKVAHYWPEFAQKGKENVTVRMLLNHEAGLAMTDPPLSLRLLKNYEDLGKVLAGSPPIWEPGTARGYHAITFGLYASHLLTRADPKHRTIGQFFKEEVEKPFGIDFHIGLPLELNYRVCRFFAGASSVYKSLMIGISDPKTRAMTWDILVTGEAIFPKIIDNCGDICENYIVNDPEFRVLESPSHSGIGTAVGLAKAYGILANNGKSMEGKTLLSEKLIKQLLTGRAPIMKDKATGLPSTFSTGFTFILHKGRELFGHPGAGGNMAYADTENRLGAAFVSRYQSPYGFGNDPRFLALQDALHQCIEKLEAQ